MCENRLKRDAASVADGDFFRNASGYHVFSVILEAENKAAFVGRYLHEFLNLFPEIKYFIKF